MIDCQQREGQQREGVYSANFSLCKKFHSKTARGGRKNSVEYGTRPRCMEIFAITLYRFKFLLLTAIIILLTTENRISLQMP